MAQGNQPQKRNLAAETFRRNYSALHEALAQPDVAGGLTTKLFSGAIITVETRDAVQMPSFTSTQQANLLLRAVESSIKTDHTRLQKFTRVLRKQSVLEPIAKQLRQCYRELVSEARLTESSSSGSDTDSTEQHQSQELTTKDLWSIQEAVFEAREKWYDIGLALAVGVSTLDCIDKQFDNHGDKLRTTLTTWLRTATEPKWQAVVNALKNSVVGRPDLAKVIKDKHCNRAETGPTTTEPVLLALRDSHIKNMHLMEEYVERHKQTIAELQSTKHRLRQEQQAQQEVEEKQRMIQQLSQDLQWHKQTNEAASDRLRQELQEAQAEVEEKQSTIQQLTQDLEWHKQTNEAASHRLRQELQQAQAEVEEKQHAPKPSRRQVQELDELQQTTTKVQQPPMKQNTIQDMKWDKESTAPETMFRGSAASDLNRAYFNRRGSTKIHSYDSDTQKWDELPIPDTPHIQHALVIVKDLLTIVGGFWNGRATDSILSLIGDGRNTKWLPNFPAMPSARLNTTAICSGHSLIVAGGYNGAQILTVVEVLNTDTRQWSRATPLPLPFSSATASICGENLYMLGGYDRPDQPTRLVLTCSISKLIESCQPQSPGVGTIWHRVVDSPFYFSSCATLCGELVLVGGFDGIANAETADIRAYNRRTDSWQTIGLGKMPAAQFRALVVVLRDKLMVVGGILSPRKYHNRFWGPEKDAVNILH